MELSYHISAGRVRPQVLGRAGLPASEAAMAGELNRTRQPPSGLLPPCVRWWSKARRWWLLERPPQTVTVSFTDAPLEATADKAVRLFVLPIPWTLTAVCLDELFLPKEVAVFALSASATRYEDRIGILPLANCHDNGRVCLPAGVDATCATVADGIALGYRLLWDGGFNLDLGQAIHWCVRNGRPQGIIWPLAERYPLDPPVAAVYRQWERLPLDQVAAYTDWPTGTRLFELVGTEGMYTVGGLCAVLQAVEDASLGSEMFLAAWQGAYARNVSNP